MKARKLAIVFGLCFTASTLFAEMYKENVVASFYADKFNGRRTASGEIFDTNGYTAAHKTLPFGTVLKVTNLDNGKSVNVRVNDRGPFVQGREIDVSKAAAIELDMVGNGTAKVSLEIVDEAEGPSSSAAASPYGEPEEDEDPYGSYEDEEEDDYYSSSSDSSSSSGSTGFTFGGNPPFNSAPVTSNDSDYEEEEETPPPPPPSEPVKTSEPVKASEPAKTTDSSKPASSGKSGKKETTTVTTTTTTTTTTVVEETSAKRWDIQLGAYSNEGNAKVMAHKLLQAGFDNVAYQKVGNIIRVVLRDIDEADLDKFQTKLDDSGFSSYIVRERKNIIRKD